MIFSTALGNIYSLGRRLTTKHPQRFLPVLVILVVVGYALSFLDFATLVGSVFPVMCYVALVMIAVLFASWLGRGRSIVTAESRRRDKIRALVLRMVDPNEKFTTANSRARSSNPTSPIPTCVRPSWGTSSKSLTPTIPMTSRPRTTKLTKIRFRAPMSRCVRTRCAWLTNPFPSLKAKLRVSQNQPKTRR